MHKTTLLVVVAVLSYTTTDVVKLNNKGVGIKCMIIF